MVNTRTTAKKAASRSKSAPKKVNRRKTMSEPLFYKDAIVAIPGRQAGQNFKLVRVRLFSSYRFLTTPISS